MNRERERRREERTGGGALSARVRPGYRLVVIDLSAGGALVEAQRPLRPGSRVEVHLESDARRAMVAAKVLRCSVAAIDAESGVTYRAALAFSEMCDWIREAATPPGHDVPATTTASSPANESTGDLIPALTLDRAGVL